MVLSRNGLTSSASFPVTGLLSVATASGRGQVSSVDRAPVDRAPVDRAAVDRAAVDSVAVDSVGVDRAGIEPATPGFSVLCSTN